MPPTRMGDHIHAISPPATIGQEDNEMRVKIITIVSGSEVDHEVAGVVNISDAPTVKEIIDAAERCISGKNADEFYTGYDPYDGTLMRVVDGWLVVGSDREGNLHLTHAKEHI